MQPASLHCWICDFLQTFVAGLRFGPAEHVQTRVREPMTRRARINLAIATTVGYLLLASRVRPVPATVGTC